MTRCPCCKKEGLIKGPWTEAEDAILFAYVKVHGKVNWRILPKSAGLKRCGKSCRLRWLNYLRPDLKRGNMSPDEDDLIIKLHSLLGNRWSLIAGRIPGRTDNEIKNYWNTHLKHQVCSMGVGPSNHSLSSTTTWPTTDSSSDHDSTSGDNIHLQCSTDFDQGAEYTDNLSPTTSLTPGAYSDTDFDHGGSLSDINPSDYSLSQGDGLSAHCEPGSRMCVQFYPDDILEENCCRLPILEDISKELALEKFLPDSPESVVSYADMIQFVDSLGDLDIGSRQPLQSIEAHIPFFDCGEAMHEPVDTNYSLEFLDHKDDSTASPFWTCFASPFE